jgi:hypothetical protein
MHPKRSGFQYVSALHPLGPGVAKAIEDVRVASAAKALGVELGPVVRERLLSRTFCVHSLEADKKELAMVTWAEQVTKAERELFSTMAQAIHAAGDGLPGVLRVSAIAPSRDAFLTDLWTAGSVRDLSALRWPPSRRAEFMVRTVRAVDGLHKLGMVHGCLCPGNVLLNDALEPIVAEAGTVLVHALAERFKNDAQLYLAFAAPEVARGESATVRSDVYSLGRLLEDVFKEDPPNAALEEIVLRCTAGLPLARYTQAGELARALEAVVGLLPADERASRVSIPSPPSHVRPSGRAPRSDPPTRTGGSTRPGASTRPRPSTRPAAWYPPTAVGIVGLLAAASAVAVSALVGGASADLRKVLAFALVAGVALATTLVRPPKGAGQLILPMQVLLAIACAAPLVFLDPLAFTYRLAARNHLHGDAASRRIGVEEIVRLGRDFRGLPLVDVDLTGLDLREAICDGETRLPDGWSCSEGHLRRGPP